MNMVFISVLLMSVTGALLVLCLSLLRPVTQKCFAAAWHYRVCLLVTLFLLVPIGAIGGGLLAGIPNETVSELPSVPVMLSDIISAPRSNVIPEQQQPQLVDPPINTAEQTMPETFPVSAPTITVNVVLSYLPYAWLAGVVIFIFLHGIRLVRFKKKIVRTSLEIDDETALYVLRTQMNEMKIKGKLRLVSNNIVKSPMLAGLCKTYLILPEVELSTRELTVILKHELVHFKRRDLWIKSLVLLANAIHWFNPAAYRLVKQLDTFCELSCDERVVADMSAEERQFYGETILNVLCRVVNGYSGVYATLAESKKGIKKRLSHMMNFKKNSKRIMLISFAAATLLCLAGCAVASLMSISSGKPVNDEIIYNVPIGDENKLGINKLEAVITPHNNHNGEENYIWELSATLENGDVLTKIYDYHDYYVVEPELYYADLTHNGKDEIILVMPNRTSNYAAANIHVLRADNDGLTEILTILDTPQSQGDISSLESTFKDSLFIIPHIAEDEDLPMYTPENYEYFCTGAELMQTSAGAELCVRHLMKDTIPYSIIRWDGNDWYVAEQGIHLLPSESQTNDNEFQAFIDKWQLTGLIAEGLEMTTENKSQFIKYFQQFDDITFNYIILLLQGIIDGTVTVNSYFDDHENGVYLYSCEYYLYDMNGDGAPEFIMRTGNSEAGYWFTVYTIVDGKLIDCGGLSGGHASLLTDGSGDFVRYVAHMGTYEITVSTLEGTTLVTREIANGEIDYSMNEDYPELDVYGYGDYKQWFEFTGIPTLLLAPKG